MSTIHPAKTGTAILLVWILVLANAAFAMGAEAGENGASAGGGSVGSAVYAVYSSDFADTWGFTTSNAVLSVNTDDVAGNGTPKLQFTQTNQSGGRVAAKSLPASIKGEQVIVRFDWYPGKVNDKNAANPSENGGEFRIMDSSGNAVFTLNHTNLSPLRYFAGKQPAADTAVTNPQAWYTVEVNLDIRNNGYMLKLTDQAAGTGEEHSGSLSGVAFDGSVAQIRLVGMRTSGNNITWTTYLDNFTISHIPIPDNRITKVDRIPYHRVYVNETTEALSSIGLPAGVKVSLADNSQAVVGVSEWTAVGKPWNPHVAGVYEFRGKLAAVEGLENGFGRYATCYVYNRLAPPGAARQTEWLDRGAVALKADQGIFVSWRLLADEYRQDVTFNLYRNGARLNAEPLAVTNYADPSGVPGDLYRVETLAAGIPAGAYETAAEDRDYLAIPLQKPEGGTTATGSYTYSANDAGVGDLDGDGEYEVIVKWYPSNAIDSSQTGMTGPTLFDAYKLDGTLLWRINMGLNLTSGAHYNQFIVADFDGDGKSEFLIKTADATTVYGVTGGVYDSGKIMGIVGNPADNGKWVNEAGHVYGGPESITVFKGETGEILDTADYAFPLGDVSSWGDTWHNRSDRFLAGLAYLDGGKPSAVYGQRLL